MRGSVVITDFRIELRSTVAKVNGYIDASIHATGVRSYGAALDLRERGPARSNPTTDRK
jgi:hypothetical protein